MGGPLLPVLLQVINQPSLASIFFGSTVLLYATCCICLGVVETAWLCSRTTVRCSGYTGSDSRTQKTFRVCFMWEATSSQGCSDAAANTDFLLGLLHSILLTAGCCHKQASATPFAHCAHCIAITPKLAVCGSVVGRLERCSAVFVCRNVVLASFREATMQRQVNWPGLLLFDAMPLFNECCVVLVLVACTGHVLHGLQSFPSCFGFERAQAS